jgi:hypothetical protein
LNTLNYLEEWRSEQKISLPEDNFTPQGTKLTNPWVQSLSLGVKLRVGLRFLWVQTYQNRKNIPHDHKIYQVAMKYSKWSFNTYTYQHFLFKGNKPKLGFLV